MRKLATAAVLSYLLPCARWFLMLVVPMLVIIPRAPLYEWDPSGMRQTACWSAMESTPLTAVVRIVDQGDFDRAVRTSYARSRWNRNTNAPASSVTPNPSPPSWLLLPALNYLLSSIVISALLLWRSTVLLRSEAEPRTGFWVRMGTRLRRRVRPPGDGNPMTWKESRLLNTAASRSLYWTVLVLFALGLIGFVLVMRYSNPWDWSEVSYGMMAAFGTLLALVALIGGAAGMAHERASGTFDLIRISLLSPREFLHGKVVGLLRGLAFLAVIPLVQMLLSAYPFHAEGVHVQGMELLQGLLLLQTTLLWGSVGIACGIRARRVSSAVTWAMAIFGTALVLVPFVSGLLHEAGGDMRDLGQYLVGACPPARLWLIQDTLERYLSPRERSIHDEAQGALFFTLLETVITVVLPLLLPAYLVRSVQAEAGDAP